MKKKSISLIVGLMGLALLGVMSMQLYFLRQSYQMQSDLFDRSVNDALNNVVSKLARQDANNFLNRKAELIVKQRRQYVSPAPMDASIGTARTYTPRHGKKVMSARERRLNALRDSLRQVIQSNKLDEEFFNMAQSGQLMLHVKYEEFTDEFGVVHQRMTDPKIIRQASGKMVFKKQGKLHKYDTVFVDYIDPQFGKQTIPVVQINPFWQREQERKKSERQFNEVKKMLEDDSLENLKQGPKVNVIENLAAEYQKSDEPLVKRLNPFWIDSLLRFELHNKGIFLPFNYMVSTFNSDSLLFSSTSYTNDGVQKFTEAGSYQVPIFAKEVINDPGKIKISFPEKNSLILTKMTASMATSGGLLVVLIFCFGYTIFLIVKQKKVSEMKMDFINNMTHEFKTPVSTIMIASEALKDKEIVEDKGRVERLANIIFEENQRLGSHIERVLNIARIEKNDFRLDIRPLDVNEMVTTVLDSMSLKLQKHQVIANLNLDATNATIEADELHFSNVLYNLIDNAIKYSPETPEITISTFNKDNNVVIRVADKGIGMNRDQQAKIFEQFYRIPTGNLHDVKGFGLGLSYVNTIVKRLNGTISVKSEREKGSEFELKFHTT
ncbi:HAMP domain-containing sensor histidine kinase [Mucilaginibacter sp.]|jgi:two-component system phosphate regulon sensor histidine kinase PhoR|uniref:sensor histidine kinase n=1 Tax=Mucilaginibacter sp. TaxID=1882438 RepID=UPI002CFCE33C|nr:HAMP domain-containing sensor histidine kinase [Mucilaginibacter sp.]HTI57583.1 HAMP domain-containing sensor histidine kinase [Mucilaginibacter sp.]